MHTIILGFLFKVAARHVFEEAGDEGGPAGLMAVAYSAAGVAVEVFVEEDEIAPRAVCRASPWNQQKREATTPGLSGSTIGRCGEEGAWRQTA
jgi:hypothetical protein